MNALVKIEKESNPSADVRSVKEKVHAACRSGHGRNGGGATSPVSRMHRSGKMATSPMPQV